MILSILSSMPGSRSARRWLMLTALAVAFLLLAGCAQTGQMDEQPRYNPLAASDFYADKRSARSPQAGTVPYVQTGSANDPALTGLDEGGAPVGGLPVKVDQALVLKGQERFNIFCTPCHGATGEGNGKATQFGFPKPPNLIDGEATNMMSGQIFDIITNGQGKMFPYGYRVKPDERWAVIAYLRAMQLKKGKVTEQDLTPDLLNQIGSQP